MVLTDKLNRAATLAIASLLFLASLVPLLTREKASAYELLGARQIMMSSSAGGAADVAYALLATTTTTETVGSAAVEFCVNSPIIGDTCTAPTGFNINEAGLALAAQTGISDWAINASTTTNTLILTRTPASFTAGAFAVTLGDVGGSDGVTNPTDTDNVTVGNQVGTFYARVLTFADNDDDGDGCSVADDSATCYPTTAISGNSLHAGGIALSTAVQITVTAKVQERLTFCVYTFPTTESVPGAGDWADEPADPSTDNSCGGKSGSAITLGDVNGVLDSERGYVDGTSYFTISTNAAGDAVVRMKGGTLSNGAATIDAIGDAPETSDDGTEQFGMCAYHYDTSGSATLFIANGDATPSDDTTDYTGTNGADNCSDIVQSAHMDTPPAEDADHNDSMFALDTTQTTTTYGQVLAIKEAGPPTTARMAFLGNISDVTEPGIYTTTLTFIATGTY